MTWTTLAILSFIIIVLGFFVAKYWIELMIIGLIAKTLFYLVAMSGISCFIWTLIKNDTNGWVQSWIFFFILYSTITGIYAFIIVDGAGKLVDIIRYIFKI